MAATFWRAPIFGCLKNGLIWEVGSRWGTTLTINVKNNGILTADGKKKLVCQGQMTFNLLTIDGKFFFNLTVWRLAINP